MRRRLTRLLSVIACLVVSMAYSMPVLADEVESYTRTTVNQNEVSLDSEKTTSENVDNDDTQTGNVSTLDSTETANVDSTEDSTREIYRYGTSGNIEWVLYADGLLEISGSGEMNDYNSTTGYSPWYLQRKKIKNVVIMDGVTSIGEYAFYECSNMQEIALPDNLKSIGDCAFEECSSLSNISIPDSVREIGYEAFEGCTSLEEFTFPSGMKDTGEHVLNNCDNIKKIVIGDGITCITSWSFFYLQKLTDVVIPDTVTTIEENAFACCENLNSITLPHSLKAIGDMAFRECTQLNEIAIPDSVQSIGHETFQGCSNLTKVTMSNDLTDIGYHAFYGCKWKCDIHDWNTYTETKAGYLKNGAMYKECDICGTKVKVKTLPGYSSYVTKNFKVSKGFKSFTAKWSKASSSNQKKMTGYQIRYSTKSSMSGAKYAYASKSSKSKKISKLSKKKTYYVQVRNYMKKSGVTYYSKWSSKKSVKTK